MKISIDSGETIEMDKSSLIHIDRHSLNLLKLLRQIQEEDLLKKYNKILYDLEYEILQLNSELNRMISLDKRNH